MTVNPSRNNVPEGAYVHREPGPLRRALPWILLALVVIGLAYLAVVLGRTLGGGAPSFTIVIVKGGWGYALALLLAAVGLLFLTSYLGQQIGRRSGRRVNYWAVFGDQLTHVFLWIVVLIAVYPLFYVLTASFDPANSLFSFPNFDAKNVFVRTGIWPNLARFSLENYRQLFDGVTIPLWQSVLGGVIGACVAALIVIALLARAQGDTPRLSAARTWAMRALVAAVAAIVLFMTPGQFQGQGNESKFLLSVRNTVLVSGVTGLIGILLSTTAGYAIARLRFPGRFQTLLFFIFIQMFPVFLALVAVYFLLSELGLSNTFTGLILAYSGGAIAFNTWIFKGYVESLPESLEEAALVDGATRWANLCAHYFAAVRLDAGLYLSEPVYRHLRRVHHLQHRHDRRGELDRGHLAALVYRRTVQHQVGRVRRSRHAGRRSHRGTVLRLSAVLRGRRGGGRRQRIRGMVRSVCLVAPSPPALLPQG